MSAPFASFSVSSRLTRASTVCAPAVTKHKLPHKKGFPGNEKGFTLVEVMVAAVILVMTSAGIFSLLFKAYELSALARYRDDARAVLQTYAAQFEQMNPNYSSSTNTYTLGGTTMPGNGLQYWDNSSDLALSSLVYTPSSSPITVTNTNPLYLGGNSISTALENSKLATVSYIVTPITQDANHTPLTFSTSNHQTLLQANFKIVYQVYGRSITQSLTVTRLTWP